jgi:hypothetical protein
MNTDIKSYVVRNVHIVERAMVTDSRTEPPPVWVKVQTAGAVRVDLLFKEEDARRLQEALANALGPA